ncbi:MAG: type II secretion system protein GspL, partial [Synergistaceae bacterium]
MEIKNSFSVFKSSKEKASSVSAKKRSIRKLKFFTPESALSSAKEAHVYGETYVLLLPLRTLVSYPFALPFGRKGRMSEALSLKFRPVLGEREELLSLVPQVTHQTSNSTDGIAWFVSKSEIKEWEAEYGTDFVFWPAPMAFMPDDGTSSLVLCEDESGVCAAWFDGGVPLLYRWMPKAPDAAESLSEQMSSYAKSLGRPIESERIVNLDGISSAELSSAASAELFSERGLDTLNLSSKGADNAKELEK